MNNPQELKKAILAVLAEKGEYGTMLAHLSGEEKEEREYKKTERLNKLIEPLSEFAELMTANTKGVLMENLDKNLTKSTKRALSELAKQINGAVDALQTTFQDSIEKAKGEMSDEHLTRLAEARIELEQKMTEMAVTLISERASEMFAELGEQAKLTEDEISEIIDQTALSVESQISNIIGDYVRETGITVSQISDFKTEVLKLIPQFDPSRIRINASQISGLPDFSGAASRAWVETRLATLGSASSFLDLTDTPSTYSGQGGTLVAVKGDESGIEFIAPPSGSGDVVGPASSTNDNIVLFNGVTGKIIKDGGATIAQVRDRSTHTGTQTASTISDFDIEVSNNTDVAANTAARHGAVTVTDTATINHTLTGQDLQSEVIDDSITFAKIQNISTNRILGRSTAGTGNVEELNATAVPTLIGLGTSDSPQFSSINIGHATDTTITRVSAGVIAVEGVNVSLAGHTHSLSAITDVTATATELNVLDGIPATLTATELGYVDGVTSAIQTQLDSKYGANSNPTFDLITYDSARGKVTSVGNLGATETINMNDETTYLGTLDSNLTLTLGNAAVGDEVTFVGLYSGAQRTLAFGGSPTIIWCDNNDGSAPTMPSATGQRIVITFRCISTDTFLATATGNYAVYS